MKTLAIAMICHGINVAYRQSLGDTSQPAWGDLPDSQKQGIIAGVEMHIANPDATPEQNHEAWYKQKEAEGWAYGEVFDAENKLHPCFLHYEELPQAQKAKDYLFRSTVHLVKNLPDSEEYLELSNQLVKLQKQFLDSQKSTTVLTQKQVVGVGVRYINKNRERFSDHLYGTGLTFEYGVTVIVPKEIAQKLLSHSEFERVDDNSESSPALVQEQVAEKIEQKQEEERQQEDQIFDEIEAIKAMRTKISLKEYIKSRYGDDVQENLKVTELQAIAIEKVHSFGVV